MVGMRDNVRAVGEYSAEEAQSNKPRTQVQDFLKSLEAVDTALFQVCALQSTAQLVHCLASHSHAFALLDKTAVAVVLANMPKASMLPGGGSGFTLEATLHSLHDGYSSDAISALQASRKDSPEVPGNLQQLVKTSDTKLTSVLQLVPDDEMEKAQKVVGDLTSSFQSARGEATSASTATQSDEGASSGGEQSSQEDKAMERVQGLL